MTNKSTAPSIRAFHTMVKPSGAICNLDCKYCYFLSKEMMYPGSRFRIADEILETFIKQYIEAQSVPEVTFAWLLVSSEKGFIVKLCESGR